MIPYMLMIAVPGILALSGMRRAGFLFFLVALLYCLMIGFRFKLGGDWNNYLHMYGFYKSASPGELIFQREPGYKLLMWLAGKTGLGFIAVNLMSGLAFCIGFFAVARRCREPFIAIVVATPLLVVAFAMSAARQALAIGVIFYAFATWERRGTFGRTVLVLLAASFHFSALFVLVFVALSSRFRAPVRFAGAAVLGTIIWLVITYAPTAVESYADLYVGRGEGKLQAPGAIAHMGVIIAAGLAYFAFRAEWTKVNEENTLYRTMAIGSLFALPAILISSVGAYRFSLYFWPMAMYVWSGLPAIIHNPTGRAWYRLLLVAASFLMLVGWLQFANTSVAWLPYRNWLLEPSGTPLYRTDFGRP